MIPERPVVWTATADLPKDFRAVVGTELVLEANPYRWRVLRGGEEVAGETLSNHRLEAIRRRRNVKRIDRVEFAKECAVAALRRLTAP